MTKSSENFNQKKSLHEVMNELVRTEPTLVPARVVSVQALEEALVMLDPVLAGLQKQMLNAAADHCRVHTKHGAADFMSVISSDRVDSARCAFATRLLELKRQRHVMIEARALMREIVETTAQAQRDRMVAYLQRLKLAWDEQCARIRDAKKRKIREDDDFILYLTFWLLIITPNGNNIVTLRHRFSTVSTLQEAA